MRADVAGLDELNKRISSLVTTTEINNLRFAIRDHINILYESLRKVIDGMCIGDSLMATPRAVENEVITPVSVFHASFSP
jgi:hypothetical protein